MFVMYKSVDKNMFTFFTLSYFMFLSFKCIYIYKAILQLFKKLTSIMYIIRTFFMLK